MVLESQIDGSKKYMVQQKKDGSKNRRFEKK